nr:unnamed protein product [Callosobruchus chinensis]
MIIYFIVLYIPPSVASYDFDLFFETLEQWDFLFGKKVVFLGDFNITNFFTDDIGDSKSRTLINFLSFFNFNQCNSILNDHGRLLDLVISNLVCCVDSDDSPLIQPDSHHPALIVTFPNIYTADPQFEPNQLNETYNFKKANFPFLYDAITHIEWSFLNQITDVDIAVDEFYKKLYELIDAYVPVYKNYKRKFPCWFNSAIIINIKDKAKNLRKWRQTKKECFLLEFKGLRVLIKIQTSDAYKQYVRCTQDSISFDPFAFWTFIHQKSEQTRIPGKLCDGNASYNDPQQILNAFATFFGSVYSIPQSSNDSANGISQACNIDLASQPNTADEISVAVKRLKNKMTSGTDKLPSFFVKDCTSALKEGLITIFNLVLNTSTFPRLWKETKVCPVYKSGDRNKIPNYRPISVLNNFAKLFEVIIYVILDFIAVLHHISQYYTELRPSDLVYFSAQSFADVIEI